MTTHAEYLAGAAAVYAEKEAELASAVEQTALQAAANALLLAEIERLKNPAPSPAPQPAPSPSPTSELYQITEGSAAIEEPGLMRDYFYAHIAPWRQRGGDWSDANGVMHGPVAVSRALALSGQWCELDVTQLIEPGKPVQIVVRNMRGEAARRVTGRRGQNAPQLVVDGAAHPCLASAAATAGTAVNANAVSSFNLAAGTTLFLRFAPVTGTRATLRIFVEQAWGNAADLGTFRLEVPVPPLTGDDSFATLEGQSDLYYSTSSFDGPEYNDLRNIKTSNRFEQYDWVDDPRMGRALRIWMDPRQGMVFNAAVPFPESDRVAFEYDVLHLSEPGKHGMRDAGKMPGFRSATKPDDKFGLSQSPKWAHIEPGSVGSLLAGNGGAKVHGDDGWSLRGSHGKPWAVGHPLEGHIYQGQYAYHPDMEGLYGDSWAWTQRSVEGIPLGKATRIYQRLKVNSIDPVTGVGRRDGELECRVNGRLVFMKRDLYLRSGAPWSGLARLGVNTKGGCRSVWLNMWHGGTSMPLHRFPFVLVNNLKVALL